MSLSKPQPRHCQELHNIYLQQLARIREEAALFQSTRRRPPMTPCPSRRFASSPLFPASSTFAQSRPFLKQIFFSSLHILAFLDSFQTWLWNNRPRPVGPIFWPSLWTVASQIFSWEGTTWSRSWKLLWRFHPLSCRVRVTLVPTGSVFLIEPNLHNMNKTVQPWR